MEYPLYDRHEELPPDGLMRLVTGEPVMADEASELAAVFHQLKDFAREVTNGGAWPAERVHLMNWRAENLAARKLLPLLPYKGATDDS